MSKYTVCGVCGTLAPAPGTTSDVPIDPKLADEAEVWGPKWLKGYKAGLERAAEIVDLDAAAGPLYGTARLVRIADAIRVEATSNRMANDDELVGGE